MTHAIRWFEIPSMDFERAVDFYATVLGREIDVMDDENGRAGMFRTDEDEVGGMIVGMDDYTTDSGATISYAPTADSGVLNYLSVDGDLNDALSRVESNGGEVLAQERMEDESGGHFHYAVLIDTEGNRIGLIAEE